MNRQIYAASTLSGRGGCCAFCFGYLKSEEIEIEESSCVCGKVYCSKSCLQQDHRKYHWLLCTASSHPAQEYERMSNLQQDHDKVTWKLLGVTMAAFISSAHETFISAEGPGDDGVHASPGSSWIPQPVFEPSLISATVEDAAAHLEKKWNELIAVVESPACVPTISDTFEEAYDVLVSGCVCTVEHSQVLHPLFFKAVQQFCQKTINPYKKESQEWNKLVFLIQKQQKTIYKDGYYVIEARNLVSAATNMTPKSQRLVRILTSIINIHNIYLETCNEQSAPSDRRPHLKRSRDIHEEYSRLSDRNADKIAGYADFGVDKLDDSSKTAVQYQRSCLRLAEAATDGSLAAACNYLVGAAAASESKLKHGKGNKKKKEEEVHFAKEGETIEIAALILGLPNHSCLASHTVELAKVSRKINSLPIVAELAPIALGNKSTKSTKSAKVSLPNVAVNHESDQLITISCLENGSTLSTYQERKHQLRDIYKTFRTTASGETTMECPCILCEYERWHHERGIDFEDRDCDSSLSEDAKNIVTIFKRFKGGGTSSGSGDANTLPKHIYDNLKDIAYAYMRANKMKFALHALHVCLTSPPPSTGSQDGDIWYALGAALLSVPGRWQEAHSVWKEGLHHCPSNTQLRTAVLKLQQYEEIQSIITSVEADNCETYGAIVSHDDRIMLTKDQIITAAECQQAIDSSEEYAENSGWTTSRHYAVPTTDIPIHSVPKLFGWLSKILLPRILPIMSKYFFASHHSCGGTVRAVVHDAFLVKYDAEAGQRHLPLHTDESTHSLTVALNSIDEYDGGGTYFDCLNGAIRPTRGQILAFDGNLLHGGDPLLTGMRYIVAVFLFMATVPKIPASIEQSKYVNLLSNRSASSKKPESTARSGSPFTFSFL